MAPSIPNTYQIDIFDPYMDLNRYYHSLTVNLRVMLMMERIYASHNSKSGTSRLDTV